MTERAVTIAEMTMALRTEIAILEHKVTAGPQHLAALRAALRLIESHAREGGEG